MRRSTLVLSSLLLTTAIVAQPVVRVNIKELPDYHASGSAVYIAGSFNGWNPQDEHYKFQKDGSGHYYIDLKLAAGSYEYKLTRGGWDKVECRKGGAAVGNRSLTVPADQPVEIRVEDWQDRYPAKPRVSTASKNVCVIDTAFLIPQLKRTRRVWIYLPEDYCDSKKKYPVLYMHDGQNVFDDATSFSGEWCVDEFMDTTTLKKCIVVAIDHGGNKRLNEYNPYDNERFGAGEGDAYVDFLAKTLKPYIDKHYRTFKNKGNTFIAGSSMGGLISMYAMLKYPNVFGGAGVFSSAFWVTGSKIYDDLKARGEKIKGKIYFYGGKLEGEGMVPNILKAFESLAGVSKSMMTTVIRDDGEHNEPAWRKEFPAMYRWLVKD